jgi:translation initiation factor IF-1
MRYVNGQWTMELQMSTGDSVQVSHWAYMTQLLSGTTPPPPTTPSTSDSSQTDNWSWLAGTTWYVPSASLLAYITGPLAQVNVPIGDQTVFDIQGYNGGYFWGQTVVQLSADSGVSGQGTSPSTFALFGSVTPEGDVLVTFTPSDPTQPTTTGQGTMRYVDGQWRIELQMSTGTGLQVSHWAYMTQLPPGTTPPPPVYPSGETWPQANTWSWLANTSWYVPAPNLLAYVTGPLGQVNQPIGDQTIFNIQGYDQGFFWGNTVVQLSSPTQLSGEGTSPSTFSLFGSVTPEGNLLLTFTPSDPSQPTTSGQGTMRYVNGQWTMELQMSTGDSVQVSHWAYMMQS